MARDATTWSTGKAIAIPLTAALVLAGSLPATAAAASGATLPRPVVRRASVTLPASPPPAGSVVTVGVDGHQLDVGATSGATCRLDVLRAATLQQLGRSAVNCDDPRLVGATAWPVESAAPGSPTGTVRIAVRPPGNGPVRLGPVVLRYPNLADGRPEWVDGGGFLWLADAGSPATPTAAALPAVALRISTRTGAVLQRVAMPMVTRLVLAADADGLWFGPSADSAAPPPVVPALLSFVPLHATRPTVLEPATRSDATRPDATRPDASRRAPAHLDWLVAAGHTAWVAQSGGSPGRPATVATWRSPAGPPRSVPSRLGPSIPDDPGQPGLGTPPPVQLVPRVGLVATEQAPAATAPHSGRSRLTLAVVDPSTGRARPWCRLAIPPAARLLSATVAGDALYLVVAVGDGRLIVDRVTPRSG